MSCMADESLLKIFHWGPDVTVFGPSSVPGIQVSPFAG